MEPITWTGNILFLIIISADLSQLTDRNLIGLRVPPCLTKPSVYGNCELQTPLSFGMHGLYEALLV